MGEWLCGPGHVITGSAISVSCQYHGMVSTGDSEYMDWGSSCQCYVHCYQTRVGRRDWYVGRVLILMQFQYQFVIIICLSTGDWYVGPFWGRLSARQSADPLSQHSSEWFLRSHHYNYYNNCCFNIQEGFPFVEERAQDKVQEPVACAWDFSAQERVGSQAMLQSFLSRKNESRTKCGSHLHAHEVWTQQRLTS